MPTGRRWCSRTTGPPSTPPAERRLPLPAPDRILSPRTGYTRLHWGCADHLLGALRLAGSQGGAFRTGRPLRVGAGCRQPPRARRGVVTPSSSSNCSVACRATLRERTLVRCLPHQVAHLPRRLPASLPTPRAARCCKAARSSTGRHGGPVLDGRELQGVSLLPPGRTRRLAGRNVGDRWLRHRDLCSHRGSWVSEKRSCSGVPTCVLEVPTRRSRLGAGLDHDRDAAGSEVPTGATGTTGTTGTTGATGSSTPASRLGPTLMRSATTSG